MFYIIFVAERFLLIMETIYKGTVFELNVVAPKEDSENVAIRAYLHNKATKTVVEITQTGNEHNEETYTFFFNIDKETTKTMPVGLYDLDVYDGGTYTMFRHFDNFARCVTSSLSTE